MVVAANATSRRFIQRLTGRPAEEVNRDVFMGSEASLQEIDRAYREYRNRFATMSSLGDEVMARRDALEYYVDLFSAQNIKSFRSPRRISVQSLDPAVIDELIEGLRAATADLRRALVAEYPGGLSELQWIPRNDPFLSGLIRMELEAAQAG